MAPSMILTPSSDNTKLYYSKGIRQKYLVDTAVEPHQPAEPATDITFNPDLDVFLARRARRLLAGGLEKKVPERWPTVLSGRMAWKGADFEDESQFVYHFSIEEKEEIRSTLDYFKAQDLPNDNVTRESFPLPILGPRLIRACEEIYKGVGVAIFRGLSVDEYSGVDLAVILLGVSQYIAERKGMQLQDGTTLGEHPFFQFREFFLNFQKHIWSTTENWILNLRWRQPFHTDITCDVVATLTRNCSTNGGMATVASTWTVYNELAATRPDLIHVLAEPDWPLDTYGRDPPYYKRALLYYLDGKAIMNFSRRVLVGHPYHPRSPGVPLLSEAQAEALDAVHYLALENQKRITMEKGDIRFVNNMGLLHGREGFSDGAQEKSERHLLRLWLHNEKMAWTLPPPLKLAWARVFEDKDRKARFDVEPSLSDSGSGSGGGGPDPAQPCD